MKLSITLTGLVGSLLCISPIFGQNNSAKAIDTSMILLIYQAADLIYEIINLSGFGSFEIYFINSFEFTKPFNEFELLKVS
jgi:hypothetical protein